MTAASLPAHPVAALLPAMGDDEYAELLADVQSNGLRSAIVVADNQVLDGRHRLRACIEADVEPRFEEFDGDDPVSFVLAMNLTRRHLTPSQRAAVAVDAEAMFTEAAKKRQRASGGDRRNGKPKSVTPDLEEPKGEALAQAARAAGASRSSAANAKKVKAEDPETFEQIRAGEVTVDKATKDVTQRIAYRDAVAEFPFLGPEQSPGVPEKEVISMAEGLRATPDGAERKKRVDAAKRWHLRYSPSAIAAREALGADHAAHEAAAKVIDALSAMNLAVDRAGGAGVFEDLNLDAFERDAWQQVIDVAVGVTGDIAQAFPETNSLRRVK